MKVNQKAWKILSMILVWSNISFAFSADEIEVAKDRLEGICEAIDDILYFVLPLDLQSSRLRIIKNKSVEILDLIDDKGLANLKTMQAYQHLIVYFRYSKALLAEVTTNSSYESVEKLKELLQQISDARGIDDAPYTKMTYNIFSKQKLLFDQLLDTEILDDDLRKKIINLKGDFGRIMALSSEGDHRLVYPDAVKLYNKIADLYVDFDPLFSSEVTFALIVDIQGLNELFGEFAKIGDE